jgi:arginine utilization regulatory protein
MEDSLLGTLDLLQAIMQTIDEGIHAVDRSGKTIFYNDAAGRLDGLKPEDVIGKHVLEVFPSLAKESSTLLQVLETGIPIRNRPQTYTNYLGIQVHTLNTTLPILKDGTVIGAVEVSKNMTEVKRLSEQVLDLQAHVVQSSQGIAKTKKQKNLQPLLSARYTFDDILTRSPIMQHLKEIAQRAAASSSPVLVYGETGTGKELFVQAIHNASPRAQAPFLAQNCAALPASLLEGILFGTTRGSFTGAEDRPGLFELADGGTLFLDEINSMPVELQAKLLRVLQEGTIRRIGATEVRKVDVRVMAATNVNPIQLVKEKQLRADLFYRLNVVSIALPRLVERREDIPLLIAHFLNEWNRKLNKTVTGLDADAQRCLDSYDWPGNVRELAHVIEGAINIADGPLISIQDLPWYIRELDPIASADRNVTFQSDTVVARTMAETIASFDVDDLNLRKSLQAFEYERIQKALSLTHGNIQQAARLLGIPRQTLQYKLIKAKRKDRFDPH